MVINFMHKLRTMGIFSFLKKKILKMRVNEFFNAIENNDIEKVREFLENEYPVNTTHPSWDWPAAMSAISYPAILTLLIEYGVNINAQETNKWYTPLINASRLGMTDAVKILLKNNADTHLTSFVHFPALFYALEFKHPEIINLLLEHETDAEFINEVIRLCDKKNVDIKNYLDLLKKRIREIENLE